MLFTVIFQEIAIGGKRIDDLLKLGKGKLDVEFFNQVLEFATWMDSDVNVGKIALYHLGNIQHCMKLAEKEGKYHAYVMLSLITAALSGDKDSLNQLSLGYSDKEISLEGDVLPLFVHCDLFSVDVSSKVPIEIAQQNNHIEIVNEFLLKTNVCPEQGYQYVHWVGLQLRSVDVALLGKINWVKILWLSRNKLATLPEELGDYLKQVM